MNRILVFMCLFIYFSCNSKTNNDERTKANIDDNDQISMIDFGDIVPSDKLIHKGIFNPEMDEYFFTLSDKQYAQFDVFVIKRVEEGWSKPEKDENVPRVVPLHYQMRSGGSGRVRGHIE